MTKPRISDADRVEFQWPILTTEALARGSRPLNDQEQARCVQAARRLTSCIRDLVESLPPHAQSATGMSRHLGLVRNTCQRIVTGLADHPADAATLVKLPGVEGLRQFAVSLREHGGAARDIASLEAAVDQLQALFREVAGSQLRLGERLKATILASGTTERSASPGEGQEDPQLRARIAHFNSAATLANEFTEVYVDISVLRATTIGAMMRQERLNAAGHILRHARQGARPLINASVVHTTPSYAGHAQGLMLDGSVGGAMGSAVVERFSTSPLPLVTGRTGAGEVRMIIDPRGDDGRPVTIVTTSRLKLEGPPDEDRRRARDNWVQPGAGCPTRHMIFDLYLHRDLASRYVPSAEVLLDYPPLLKSDRWAMSLDHPPRLEVLGIGTSRAAARAYADHADVTNYLFENSGWNPEEFVGYRCEVAYPIWLAHYNIRLQASEMLVQAQNMDDSGDSL